MTKFGSAVKTIAFALLFILMMTVTLIRSCHDQQAVDRFLDRARLKAFLESRSQEQKTFHGHGQKIKKPYNAGQAWLRVMQF